MSDTTDLRTHFDEVMLVETLRILVTVKAYPVVSRKKGEVECVAGIDTDRPRWIRLYPVPFRDLPRYAQFKKFQIIEVQARKAGDPRPESYTPNTDSIRLLCDPLPTGRAEQRRAFLEPLMQPSMCAIRRRREADGTSLGVFPAGELLDFVVERDETAWDTAQQAQVDQLSLLLPDKDALEKVPYRFKYVYRCPNEPKCNTHTQSILDWEIHQAFRSWRDQSGSEEVAIARIRYKWCEQMWGPARDTYFFTGNRHDSPDSFLILGVFWPQKLEPSLDIS
jgi:hypothetical protein